MAILNRVKGTLMKIKGAINSPFINDMKQLAKPRLVSPVPISQPSRVSQMANITKKYVAPTLGKLAVRSYQTTPSTIIGTALGQALRDIITQRTKPTFISPVPQNNIPNYQANVMPVRSTLPKPALVPTPVPPIDYSRVISEGLKRYNQNAPVIQYAPDFAEQIPKYDILKRHPYLQPSVSILETSGGQYLAGENNILNWGIRQQQQGNFSPKSVREVIEKMASGVGERFPYYKQFRESGNIGDFARVYAPPVENKTEDYIKNLIAQMEVFKQIENELYGQR